MKSIHSFMGSLSGTVPCLLPKDTTLNPKDPAGTGWARQRCLCILFQWTRRTTNQETHEIISHRDEDHQPAASPRHPQHLAPHVTCREDSKTAALPELNAPTTGSHQGSLDSVATMAIIISFPSPWKKGDRRRTNNRSTEPRLPPS